MNTATFVKTVRRDAEVHQALYRLDPPLEDHSPLADETVSHEYVVVSAANRNFGFGARVFETYIFPADEDGEITDWGELHGSYKGGTDHRLALQNAGYTLVGAEGGT